MTPDGISTEDWTHVHELAVKIVNAGEREDDVLREHHTQRMFETLDMLEQRYGRIPSVLSTRADYLDDQREAIQLHREALSVSEDPLSTRLSLQSLIELMIEERRDKETTLLYLKQLTELTDLDHDSSDQDELLHLRREFEKQSFPPGPNG